VSQRPTEGERKISKEFFTAEYKSFCLIKETWIFTGFFILFLFCGPDLRTLLLEESEFQTVKNNFLLFSTEEIAKVVLNLKFFKRLRKKCCLNLLWSWTLW